MLAQKSSCVFIGQVIASSINNDSHILFLVGATTRREAMVQSRRVVAPTNQLAWHIMPLFWDQLLLNNIKKPLKHLSGFFIGVG